MLAPRWDLEKINFDLAWSINIGITNSGILPFLPEG
jgi:hypothetical protein